LHEQFWHNCWTRNHIGFHQRQTDLLLETYLDSLLKQGDKHVFVPLCGKSQDMNFLAQRMQVSGVELSEIACRDFFTEQKLNFSVKQQGQLCCFSFANVALFQGDFFTLSAKMLKTIDWIYDRAALFALPKTMQQAYINHLLSFMAAHSRLLLVALEFPEHEMQGPPFPVRQKDIEQLFCPNNTNQAEKFNIQCLATRPLPDKKFAQRTFKVSHLVERLYLISRE
jgi:thiopurine S-methyltransferase